MEPTHNLRPDFEPPAADARVEMSLNLAREIEDLLRNGSPESLEEATAQLARIQEMLGNSAPLSNASIEADFQEAMLKGLETYDSESRDLCVRALQRSGNSQLSKELCTVVLNSNSSPESVEAAVRALRGVSEPLVITTMELALGYQVPNHFGLSTFEQNKLVLGIRNAAVEALRIADSEDSYRVIFNASMDVGQIDSIRKICAALMQRCRHGSVIDMMIDKIESPSTVMPTIGSEAQSSAPPPELEQAFKERVIGREAGYQTRLAFAMSLRGSEDPEVHRVLIAGLADPDFHLGLASARALTGVRHPETTRTLIEALRHENLFDKFRRWTGRRTTESTTTLSRYARALTGNRSADAEKALTARLKDSDLDIVISCATALQGTQNPAAIKALAGLVKHSSVVVRRSVVEALAGCKLAVGQQALCSALADENKEVYMAAARSLAGTPHQPSQIRLAENIMNSDRDYGRLCTESLKGTKEPEAIRHLARAFWSKDSELRKSAATALQGIEDQALIEPVLHALSASSAPVRETAALALRKSPSLDARKKLLERGFDSNLEVAVTAIESLAGVNTPETRDAMKKFMLAYTSQQDPNWLRAVAAAQTLATINDDATRTELCASLADPDPAMRTLGLIALRGSMEVSTARAIVPLLKDPDREVRLYAARALNGVWHEFAVAELIRFSRSQDPEMQKICLASLAALMNG
jgi:HEAT repeat protein